MATIKGEITEAMVDSGTRRKIMDKMKELKKKQKIINFLSM
jgi:hypothetical protein